MRNDHSAIIIILLLLISGWGCATAPQKTNSPPFEGGPGETLKRLTTMMQTPSEPRQAGVPTTATPASPSMGDGGPAATYKYLLNLMETPAVKRQTVTSGALAPAPFAGEKPTKGGSAPSPEPPPAVPSTPPATAMALLPPLAESEGVGQTPPPAVLPLQAKEEARTQEFPPLSVSRTETAAINLGTQTPPPSDSLRSKEEHLLSEKVQGDPKDYAEAVKWYREAAEQGNAKGQFNLGMMYNKGQGVPQDYAEAAKWYRKAAEQGFAEAQNNLGMMYHAGQGVPQDYAEAARWYRKAAAQGIASAQFNLGLMYDKRQGVPQNFVEAVNWYRKAAEQGNAEAQYNLGMMYFAGLGVPKDYAVAHMWFHLATSRYPASEKAKRERAEVSRDIAASKLTPGQIAEAQRLAGEWKPKTEP